MFFRGLGPRKNPTPGAQPERYKFGIVIYNTEADADASGDTTGTGDCCTSSRMRKRVKRESASCIVYFLLLLDDDDMMMNV